MLSDEGVFSSLDIRGLLAILHSLLDNDNAVDDLFHRRPHWRDQGDPVKEERAESRRQARFKTRLSTVAVQTPSLSLYDKITPAHPFPKPNRCHNIDFRACCEVFCAELGSVDQFLSINRPHPLFLMSRPSFIHTARAK